MTSKKETRSRKPNPPGETPRPDSGETAPQPATPAHPTSTESRGARQALRIALVAALGQRQGDSTTPKPGPPPYQDKPLSKKEESRAAAAILGKPESSITAAEVAGALKTVKDAAEAHAQRTAQYLDDFAEHLEAIGCTPGKVAEYLQLGDQVLASLYLLAAKGNPSPTEMLRLAFRYAIDARKAIEGDMARFTQNREPAGWRIVEHRSTATRLLNLPLPGTLVKDRAANLLLDCAFNDPPRLMDVIEGLLRKVPTPADALPQPGKPVLTYALVGEEGKQPRIRLWIDEKEVPLKDWLAVHKLLIFLCSHPQERRSGRKLGEELKITNASQTVARIRKVLEATRPGAGSLLQTDPLGWVEGCVPTIASTVPGKGAK